jgi:hypothetical protein
MLMLSVPAARRLTLGDRAFSVAAAGAWNSLPSVTRLAPSLDAFRRQLETFVFHFARGSTDSGRALPLPGAASTRLFLFLLC